LASVWLHIKRGSGIKSDLQALGVNLNNATQIDQLYLLGPNGNIVIMDNAFVQEVIALDGTVEYIRVAYNDSKYTNAAGWSPNQKSEIITVFKNDKSKQFIRMTIRTETNRLKELGLKLSKGDEVRLYREDVFKTISDGTGNYKETFKMNVLDFKD
jgi:hypothetical protein